MSRVKATAGINESKKDSEVMRFCGFFFVGNHNLKN